MKRDETLDHVLVDAGEGTTTWIVWGSTRHELLQRVTLIFDEHINDDDEVHVAYNAMQSGWQERPATTPHKNTGFTELFFEYSALILVRRRANRQHELTKAIWALIDRLDST